MGNIDKHVLQSECKETIIRDINEASHSSFLPKLSAPNSRPTSMVMKRAKSLIPAHLIAEAISSLNGLDLRWSGPVTPTEMQYVEQYVIAKHSQYCTGLLIHDQTLSLSSNQPSPENTTTKPNSPSSSPSTSINHMFTDIDKPQLLQSKLLETLTRKFISIPEIQARNRALRNCGLTSDNYAVVFVPDLHSAMTMIGENYPFSKGNSYLTILNQQIDAIRDFPSTKESKVIPAPESWLDLRIRGSQHSYPAEVEGVRYSMHWVLEAHRNAWRVLGDAAAERRMNLALHRPDFVVCAVDDFGAERVKITCLMVRRKLFE